MATAKKPESTRRDFEAIAADLAARYRRSKDPDTGRTLTLQETIEPAALLDRKLAEHGLAVHHGETRTVVYRLDAPVTFCVSCGRGREPWQSPWRCTACGILVPETPTETSTEGTDP